MSKKVKVLMISIEFIDPIFSGNGIASRSLARAVLSIPDSSLLILCGRPRLDKDGREIERDGDSILSSEFASALRGSVNETSPVEMSRLAGHAIPLSKWYRTDINSAYEEFADGTFALASAISDFNPDICLAIDWTGTMAYRRLCFPTRVHCVFFSFCVYTFLTTATESERTFYAEEERLAMERATLTMAICSADLEKLKKLVDCKSVKILPPPLRADFHAKLKNGTLASKRRFITCCQRLHPSKNVETFIKVIELLKPFLLQQNLVPLLCGAAADVKYAEECRRNLRNIFPSCIIYVDFLSADDFAEVLAETKLNVHTALYEPYGMTIIEAAAAGAASIVHSEWKSIGATDLLDPTQGASLIADMSRPDAVAAAVQEALMDSSLLLSVADKARERALAWDEAHYAQDLAHTLLSLSASDSD